MPKNTLPEWEQVLSAAAHLQQILGSLDGIETGVRQLIRKQPLETTVIDFHGRKITVPTKQEILRIKAALILKRNATRDYLDFIALADQLGIDQTVQALMPFDALYPQPNQESPLQQLQIQLANPLPYDLDATRLDEYKNLDPKWQNWQTVRKASSNCATAIFERLSASQ